MSDILGEGEGDTSPKVRLRNHYENNHNRSDLKRRGDSAVTSARIKDDPNFIRSLETSADPKQTVWKLLANP